MADITFAIEFGKPILVIPGYFVGEIRGKKNLSHLVAILCDCIFADIIRGLYKSLQCQ